ncbi:MAG: HipA domain-containing protein [Deltaproteobacteria bacterium]|nr:HipA domain-containing protein [Deltaproteobacteria bacterium]
MKHCPITYQPIDEKETYSAEGPKKIAPALKGLRPFPYSAEEQRKEARLRAGKMSIQGIQPKLSANINIKEMVFEIVDRGGRFILKPQTLDYAELPENEDVTMRLAAVAGIETPFHGLMVSADRSYTYFIRRMDRFGHVGKLPLEDFAQLSQKSRETKYNSSMEQVAEVIETHCSFPLIDKAKLFFRTLFSFLVGNEDMHLKNFSLLSREGIHSLSPAYDLVNSTLALENAREELALPLNGKKNNLNAKDLLVYFPRERLGLNRKVIDQTVERFKKSLPLWGDLLENCFLSGSRKDKYRQLIEARCQRLGLPAYPNLASKS